MSHAATVAGLLEERARESPHALAFAFGRESLTYRELLLDSERIAGMLAHDGIGAGDRLAVLLPVGLEFVCLYYAAQRIGAVPCVFDPHVPEETTRRRIASVRARRVFTSAPCRDPVAPLPPRPDDADAVALLQPTSGTTGEPLCAVVLQRNVTASLHASRDLLDPGPSDVLVGWVPPWHDLGLVRFILGPVYYGIPCHLVTPAVKTVPEWLATIAEVKGTITGAPDFAWRLATRLVRRDAVDLRSLRLATNGGEPVRASTVLAFEDHFGVPGVMRPGYGLAEATLGVTSTRSGDALQVDRRGNVSCGRPLGGVDVRIEGEEIQVRGPGVFAGYFDAEEASREALRGGWLHTGDVGTLDGDGDLYVLGRRRAMIKRGGVTLAPREIEEPVQCLPGVRLAAAVGVPSALTEEIVVVVEAEPGASAVESRVRAAVEKAIGVSPDRVLIQAPRTIPRTSNGKIRHAALRDQLLPRSMRSSPSVISDGDSTR